MKIIPDPAITRSIAFVLADQSDDVLCASFELAGEDEPWVQVTAGVFNIAWPFDEPVGDRLGRLPLLPAWAQTSEDGESFATFEHGECDVAARVKLVHALFTDLYGLAADYELDVEVYALDDGGLPELVPITCEDPHTADIGTYGDGQFMGFVVASMPEPPPDDWREHKRWYAVLHTFDAEGAHRDTVAWFAGTSADGEREVIARAEKRLNALLGGLEGLSRGDVAVALFEADVQGELFGLVDASFEDDFGELIRAVELVPNDLRFGEPWDGQCDT